MLPAVLSAMPGRTPSLSDDFLNQMRTMLGTAQSPAQLPQPGAIVDVQVSNLIRGWAGGRTGRNNGYFRYYSGYRGMIWRMARMNARIWHKPPNMPMRLRNSVPAWMNSLPITPYRMPGTLCRIPASSLFSRRDAPLFTTHSRNIFGPSEIDRWFEVFGKQWGYPFRATDSSTCSLIEFILGFL